MGDRKRERHTHKGIERECEETWTKEVEKNEVLIRSVKGEGVEKMQR